MLGLMLLFALGSTIHSTIGVFLSNYIEIYNLEAGAQGLCSSMESVGLMLSAIISAMMLKILAKPKVILFMAGSMAAAFLTFSMKLPFSFLLIMYSIYGITYGAVDSLTSSLISDLDPEHSAEKIGILKAIYCLGGVVAPLTFHAALSIGVKYTRILLISGCIGVSIFVYFALCCFPEINRISGSVAVRNEMNPKDFLCFFRTRGVPLALLFALIYNGHMCGQTVWIIRYISMYMDEEHWGGYSLSLFWVGAFASRMYFPKRMKNHKNVLLYGTLASAVLYCIGMTSENGKIMCVLMLLIGFAEGASIPVVVDYVCSLKRESSAIACTCVMLTTNIGSAVFSPLIGQLIKSSGAKAGILILPVSAILCSMIALCF